MLVYTRGQDYGNIHVTFKPDEHPVITCSKDSGESISKIS